MTRSQNQGVEVVVSKEPRRARGEGTIRLRKDGTYEARVSLGYDSTGRRRQQSIYGKTRGAVLDKLLEAQREVRDGLEPAKGTPASPFLQAWLDSLRGWRASSTVATYETTVRLYLEPWLRKRPLRTLRPDDVETFYRDLAKRGVGARTIAKAYATLRAALSYAVKTEKVARNVAAMIEPPAYEPEAKTVLDVKQARKLLDALAGHPARSRSSGRCVTTRTAGRRSAIARRQGPASGSCCCRSERCRCWRRTVGGPGPMIGPRISSSPPRT